MDHESSTPVPEDPLQEHFVRQGARNYGVGAGMKVGEVTNIYIILKF